MARKKTKTLSSVRLVEPENTQLSVASTVGRETSSAYQDQIQGFNYIKRFLADFCGRTNSPATKLAFLESTVFFPLRFQSKSQEGTFKIWIGSHVIPLTAYVGQFCMLYSPFVTLVLTLLLSITEFPLRFWREIQYIGFLTTHLALSLVFVLMALSDTIYFKLRKCCGEGPSPEVYVSMLIFLAVVSLLPFNLTLYMCSDPPLPETPTTQRHHTLMRDVMAGLNITDLKTGANFIQWFFCGLVMRDWCSKYHMTQTSVLMCMVSCLIPLRSGYTLVLNIMIVTEYLTGPIIGIFRLDKYIHKWRVVLVEIFIMVACFMIFSIGRFYLELCERMDFINESRTRRKMMKLNQQLERNIQQSDQTSSTPVEEIVELVQTAKHHYELTNPEFETEEYDSQINILNKVLDILSHHEQLTQVHFGEDLGADDREQLDIFVNLYQKKKVETPDRGSILRSSRSRSMQLQISDVTRTPRSGNRAFTAIFTQDEDIPAALDGEQSDTAEEVESRPAPKLTLPLAAVQQMGTDYNVDLLMLAKTTPNLLYEVGAPLMIPYEDVLGTTAETIKNLCWTIFQHYDNNPYHNDIHGSFVGHMSIILARMTGLVNSPTFNRRNEAELIVAGLAHDVGHPGRNNAFLINTDHAVAILYNDQAVLENFHCSSLFRFLEDSKSNIFDDSTFEEIRDTRERIIVYILATDMKNHFENVSLFRVRSSAEDFAPRTSREDSLILAKTCVKAADLGHSAVGWRQHSEWSLRVTEEFYQQGDEESHLDLVVSPLCNRAMHSELAKSQLGFLEFVVRPLFVEICKMSPAALEYAFLRNIDVNRVRWESEIKGKRVMNISEEIAAFKSAESSQMPIILAENFSVYSQGEPGKRFKNLVQRRKKALEEIRQRAAQMEFAEKECQTSPRLLAVDPLGM